MQGNYKKMFWENFDENFKLNYVMILSGLTDNLFKINIINSPYIVNEFSLSNKIAVKFYEKIAKIIMKENGLENDITMPHNVSQISYKVYSINLNNYISNNNSFKSKYKSIDNVFHKRYTEGFDFNDSFSYLLGNFVRFRKSNKLIIDDTKRLLILTNLLKDFCYRKDSVKSTISRGIGCSFIEVDNDIFISKINQRINEILNK